MSAGLTMRLQPTVAPSARLWSLDIVSSQIPPTQLVDRSYSAYGTAQRLGFPQIPPTQLVDRSYSAYSRGKPRMNNSIRNSRALSA